MDAVCLLFTLEAPALDRTSSGGVNECPELTLVSF